VVTAPACHFCSDAERKLDELGERFAIDVTTIDISSPRGAEFVQLHRSPMSPLVLIDDEFFSFGRLPARKLERLLAKRRAAR
jgi:glutaredoxin